MRSSKSPPTSQLIDDLYHPANKVQLLQPPNPPCCLCGKGTRFPDLASSCDLPAAEPVPPHLHNLIGVASSGGNKISKCAKTSKPRSILLSDGTDSLPLSQWDDLSVASACQHLLSRLLTCMRSYVHVHGCVALFVAVLTLAVV
jgi:hypothetical protein